jgi:hypothetical protein
MNIRWIAEKFVHWARSKSGIAVVALIGGSTSVGIWYQIVESANRLAAQEFYDRANNQSCSLRSEAS